MNTQDATSRINLCSMSWVVTYIVLYCTALCWALLFLHCDVQTLLFVCNANLTMLFLRYAVQCCGMLWYAGYVVSLLCCPGWWQPQPLTGPLNSPVPIRVTPDLVVGTCGRREQWKKWLGHWLQAWRSWCRDGNVVIWSNSATRWRLPCLPVCLSTEINGVSSVWSATFIYM